MKIRTIIFGPLAALLMVTLSSTGCSLILDPETVCESDGDCEDGRCRNGVCVITESEAPNDGEGGTTIDDETEGDAALDDDKPSDFADAAVDGSEDATKEMVDAAALDADLPPEVDAAAEPDSALEPDATIPAEPVAPECSITLMGERLTNQSSVTVTVKATQENRPPESLSLVVTIEESGATQTIDGDTLEMNGARTLVLDNLEDGLNTIRLTATGRDGLKCEAMPATVTVDTQPPAFLEGEMPLAGQLRRPLGANDATLTFQGRLREPHFDNELRLEVNGQPREPDRPVEFEQMEERANEYIYTLIYTLTDSSPNIDIVLKASDTLGNVSPGLEYAFSFDETPPIVEITRPSEGATFFAPSVNVRAQVSEAVGAPLPSPEYYVVVRGLDAQGQATGRARRTPQMGFDTGEDTGAIRTALVLNEGANRISVCARDEVQNEACDQRLVNVVLPQIAIVSPAPEAFVTTSTVNGETVIDVTAQVGAGVAALYAFSSPSADQLPQTDCDQAVADGLTPAWARQIVDADEQVNLSITNDIEGEIHLRLLACGEDGVPGATEDVSFRVDNTAPSIEITHLKVSELGDPIAIGAGDACVGQSVFICGRAIEDESQITGISVNGQALAELPDLEFDGRSRDFRSECLPIQLRPTDREIRVTVRNSANGESSTVIPIVVHTTAPTIRFTPDHAPDGVNGLQWFRKNLNGRLPGQFLAGPCRYSELKIKMSTQADSAYREFSPGPDLTFTFNPTVDLEEGKHTLNYEALDSAGNSGAGSFDFWLDGTKPTVQLRELVDQGHVGKSPMTVRAIIRDLSGDASQLGVGIETVEMGRPDAVDNQDGMQFVRRSGGVTGEYLRTDLALTPGYNTIRVEASDLVGNADQLSVVVIYDPTPPVIELVSPQNDDVVPHDAIIQVRVFDEDVGTDEARTRAHGSGVTEVLVNEVPAIQEPGSDLWTATGLALNYQVDETGRLSAVVRITAKDRMENEATPVEMTVFLDPFAVQDPRLDNLVLDESITALQPIDLNGDNLLDLVAVPADPNSTFGIYIRQGDGRFQRAAVQGAPANLNIASTSVGDIDHDGDDDLIVSGSTGTHVFMNEAGIALDYRDQTSARGRFAFLGDITHNGWLDVVTIGESPNRSTRHTNNEAGDGLNTFRPENDLAEAEQTAWSNLVSTDLVDVDGDGLLDLIGIGADGQGYLYTGQSDDTFALSNQTGDFSLAVGDQTNLLVYDANTDGVLDILAYGGNTSRLLTNDGAGHFTEQTNHQLTWNDNIDAYAATGDMDGDGRDDIIVAGETSISIWYQRSMEDDGQPMAGGATSGGAVAGGAASGGAVAGGAASGGAVAGGAPAGGLPMGGDPTGPNVGFICPGPSRQGEVGQYEKVTLDIVVEGTVNALTVADLDTDGDFDIALATSAGVQLVYNNTRERHTLNEGTALRFVHLTAHRRKAPAANDNEQTNRANDGQGAQFQVWYHSIADVDDHLNELGNLYTCAFHAERGVKSQPSGPTLVTLGSAAYAPSVSLQVKFTDILEGDGSNNYTSRIRKAGDPDAWPLLWTGSESVTDVYDPVQ